MPIVLKSGNLNLLKPSGPLQACNGIGLTFRLEQENVVHNRRNSSELYCNMSLLQVFRLGWEMHYLIQIRIYVLGSKQN